MLGIEKSQLPVMFVLTPNEFGATKYKYMGPAGSADKAQIVQFANDFLNKKLSPYHKSAPVPKNNTGVIKEVVGSTWNHIVRKGEKEVFVRFYNATADDSSVIVENHKEVHEAWNQFCEHVKEVADFQCAQIDIEKNDVPQEHVDEVPQFKLFHKGKQAEALHQELEFHPSKHLSGFQIWMKENSPVYAAAFPNEAPTPEHSD